MKDNKFWEDYGWIIRGSQRKEVIRMMTERPITAEELRKEVNVKTNLKLSLREMSRHFTSFTKRGFIRCLTPNAPYNRLYLITPLGKKMKLEIERSKV